MLLKGGATTIERASLKTCTSRQILHSPFHDEGDFAAFQWRVSAKLTWQGQTIDYDYQSAAAYPTITRWQVLIDESDQPLTRAEVLSPDGAINTSLAWHETRQTVSENLTQPYGLVLLENERQRITAGKPLQAWTATTQTSSTAQNAALYIQSVGTATVYLNGVELTTVEPIDHPNFQPMFYSWMPPKQAYFALPLREGANSLVIATRPDVELGWWGVGAVVLDRSGNVLT